MSSSSNTTHPLAIISLILFILAMISVALENKLHLHKSEPLLLCSGLIWLFVSIHFYGDQVEVKHDDYVFMESKARLHLEEYFVEYIELFLFLLVALTFIKTMEERGIFHYIRDQLISRKFSRRQLFWITGFCAFILSPICDNLTTAMVLGTVILSLLGMRARDHSNKPTLYSYLAMEEKVKRRLQVLLADGLTCSSQNKEEIIEEIQELCRQTETQCKIVRDSQIPMNDNKSVHNFRTMSPSPSILNLMANYITNVHPRPTMQAPVYNNDILLHGPYQYTEKTEHKSYNIFDQLIHAGSKDQLSHIQKKSHLEMTEIVRDRAGDFSDSSESEEVETGSEYSSEEYYLEDLEDEILPQASPPPLGSIQENIQEEIQSDVGREKLLKKELSPNRKRVDWTSPKGPRPRKSSDPKKGLSNELSPGKRRKSKSSKTPKKKPQKTPKFGPLPPIEALPPQATINIDDNLSLIQPQQQKIETKSPIPVRPQIQIDLYGPTEQTNTTPNDIKIQIEPYVPNEKDLEPKPVSRLQPTPVPTINRKSILKFDTSTYDGFDKLCLQTGCCCENWLVLHMAVLMGERRLKECEDHLARIQSIKSSSREEMVKLESQGVVITDKIKESIQLKHSSKTHVSEDILSFASKCCVNVVVASNAGGVFSPFGDITTLMVWTADRVLIVQFLYICVPAIVAWIIPAIILTFFIKEDPLPDPVTDPIFNPSDNLREGAIPVTILFLLSICTAITFHSVFAMPPAIGMMFGLGVLCFLLYYIEHKEAVNKKRLIEENPLLSHNLQNVHTFDMFRRVLVSKTEWDIILFFLGIVLAVGGLAIFGYLNILNVFLFDNLGAQIAAPLVGIISSVMDNIPMMLVILDMKPIITEFEWLLVTLCAGIGGSLLSIGSAAGVGLMGIVKDAYTFTSHMKWLPAIMVGYFASIGVHFAMNSHLTNIVK